MWNSSTMNSNGSKKHPVCKMELFVTIITGLESFAFVTKSTILDVAKVLNKQVKSLKKPVKKSNLSNVAGIKSKTQVWPGFLPFSAIFFY